MLVNSTIPAYRAAETPDLYNWKVLTVDELKEFPDALKQMYNREIDGMTVKGVLSQAECQTVVEAIGRIPEEKCTWMPEGFGYPRIFAQMVRHSLGEANRDTSRAVFEAYFNDCERIQNEFADFFGVDLIGRVESIFEKVAGGREIGVPVGFEGKGRYPNCTVRGLKPDVGNISVHSGNYFQYEFADFYKHLATNVDVKDQLSYFITVQAPDVGGELTLYDLEWEVGQTKDHPGIRDIVHLPDGTDLNVEQDNSLKKMFLAPEAGDMIMFAGGQIWHRVEDIFGSKTRFTMGGFMGFSYDDSKLIYWS